MLNDEDDLKARIAITEIVFESLCKKYVQRADLRQQEMGLQYTTAETHDLAAYVATAVMELTAKISLPLYEENTALREEIGDFIRRDVL